MAGFGAVNLGVVSLNLGVETRGILFKVGVVSLGVSLGAGLERVGVLGEKGMIGFLIMGAGDLKLDGMGIDCLVGGLTAERVLICVAGFEKKLGVGRCVGSFIEGGLGEAKVEGGLGDVIKGGLGDAKAFNLGVAFSMGLIREGVVKDGLVGCF